MATATATPSLEWIVQIHDKEGAYQKRMETVPAHLGNLKANVAAGRVVMSGPTLVSHPTGDGEAPVINGSVLVIKAASREDVLELLKQDPLAVADVWDLENATVTPFRTGVRVAA